LEKAKFNAFFVGFGKIAIPLKKEKAAGIAPATGSLLFAIDYTL